MGDVAETIRFETTKAVVEAGMCAKAAKGER
jgi:hypothetical protein